MAPQGILNSESDAGKRASGKTNEELALLIQQGETEWVEKLWQQVRRFIGIKAAHVLPALKGSVVDKDDLKQAGFFAVLNAVNYYDPSTGISFLTYLSNTLKTAFAEASGYRTSRQQYDPLHRATSLDAPRENGDGENSGTLGDMVADPVDRLQDVEDRLYQEQLHASLKEALGTLEDNQAEVLRLRFYDDLTRAGTSEALGLPLNRVLTLEQRGLARLRCGKTRAHLEQFIDARTNFYRRASISWQESPVEKLVIQREQMRLEQTAGYVYSECAV